MKTDLPLIEVPFCFSLDNIIDIERKNRLLKVCYVHATSATF
jgi:hypothetical protein